MSTSLNILNVNMTSDDECSICYGKLLEDENVYMLPECGHCYHTDCIIAWFRMATSKGKCPLCGNKGSNADEDLYTSYYTKFRLISRHINRKETPDWLKSEYKKYLNIKEKLDNHKKDMSKFVKDSSYNYVEGTKIMGKMRRKQWTLENKLRVERRMLGNIPIVPLFIPKIKYYNNI